MTRLGFLLAWTVSAAIDYGVYRTFSDYETAYWVTFAKDTVFVVGTFALLTETALGLFNKASC